MNGRFSIVVALVAVSGLGLSLSACNAPTCGPGTKQVQQPNGELQCVEVDSPSQLIDCDVDAGAAIVGGRCVGAVTCGPNTTLMNGQCVGTGGGGGVPQCGTPMTGHFCVSGAILNFVDNMPWSGSSLHVSAWEPLTFLSPGGTPLDQTDVTTGSYILPNVPAPSLPLIVIVTGDADFKDVTWVNTGSPDQGIAGGGKYRIDAYALPRSVADGWKPAFDFAPGGAQVTKFYNDPKQTTTALVANEMNPVSGVVMTKDGANANAKYFGSSLTTIETGLTSTSATGTAIVAAPVQGTAFSLFSGMGGGISWESFSGGSAPGVVLVTRFHPN